MVVSSSFVWSFVWSPCWRLRVFEKVQFRVLSLLFEDYSCAMSDQAADRVHLFDLAARYAHCVDRRDYPALAELFGDTGRLVVRDTADLSAAPVRDVTGGTAIAARIAESHRQFLKTFHVLGQQTATIEGDQATAETYCIAHHLFDHDGRRHDRVMYIRYDDVMVRDNGAWRFDARRLAIDWIDFPAFSDPPAGWS
jgi:hypothetical protein